MPVRKVSNRGGNSIGCFPSIKLGRMVDYESLIERDYICLLEYDPDVTWYEEQPLTITYEWDDKELTYTPDFHVVKRGRHFLVECKSEAFVDSEENRRKFLVADSWCAENRYIFEMVTDEKLRHGHKLKNIGLPLQFARHRIDPVVRQRILAFLVAPSSPVTVADVSAMVDGLKLSKLVAGYRGRPAADRAALEKTALALGKFFLDHRAKIADIEINPLMVRENGATAVDVRVLWRE